VRWAGQVARIGHRRGAYRVWRCDPRESDLTRKWENIKMNLQEVGLGGGGGVVTDWPELVQERGE